MKNVGAFCFREEPCEVSTGDPDKFYLQQDQKMWKPPLHVVQAYGWE